jgi:hypothetical protein
LSVQERSKVVVRLGDTEIEIEGSSEFVKSYIGENIFEFLGNFQSSVAEIPTEEPEKPTIPGEEALPPKIAQASGLADALRSLFDTPWGKTPKSLDVIKQVLEVNGLYYEAKVISTQLLIMIRRGNLRRIGTKGNYQYVASPSG